MDTRRRGNPEEEGPPGLGGPACRASAARRRRAHGGADCERLPPRDAGRAREPRDHHSSRPAAYSRRPARGDRQRGRRAERRRQPSGCAGGRGHVPGRSGRRAAACPGGRRRPVKGFGNIMKEAQKLQQQMEAMQAEVARKQVEATAGGGMVTVQANGKQELLSIKIDPEVISKDDAQMLEDLVLAACNEALRKSRELVQQELGKLTGGLKIPGLGL